MNLTFENKSLLPCNIFYSDSGYPFGSRSVNLSKSGIQLNNYKSSAVNLIGDDKAFLECMCV